MRPACETMRLSRSTAPRSHPPGNGTPALIDVWPGMKIFRSIHATQQRKYCSMTDQIPLSTCASVPAKTRKMDIPRRTTVRRSEPSAALTRARTEGDGLSIFLESEGIRDLPEEAALLEDNLRRTVHLQEK